MMSPKRVKYRKVQRGSMKGKAKGHTKVEFGWYGLVSTEPHWITARQIEAARVAMTRRMRRGGKVWITIFPDKPITKKPAETRMGSGKGNPEEWVAVVKPGRVMFEIAEVSDEMAREALRLAAQKLPVKCKIITLEDQGEEMPKFDPRAFARSVAEAEAAADYEEEQEELAAEAEAEEAADESSEGEE